MIRVQNQRRVSEPVVVRAVSKQTCASSPSVACLPLACSFLLNIIACVQFAVVSCRTGLRIAKAGPTGSVRGSGSRSNYISVRVDVSSSTTIGCAPAWDTVRIRVTPKGTRVELHASSHIHIRLPCIMRQCLCADHRKSGPKWNVN